MMDAPSEGVDEGYVTLVSAKYDRDDNLVETRSGRASGPGSIPPRHHHLPQTGR